MQKYKGVGESTFYHVYRMNEEVKSIKLVEMLKKDNLLFAMIFLRRRSFFSSIMFMLTICLLFLYIPTEHTTMINAP
jgi:hypothetical protein